MTELKVADLSSMTRDEIVNTLVDKIFDYYYTNKEKLVLSKTADDIYINDERYDINITASEVLDTLQDYLNIDNVESIDEIDNDLRPLLHASIRDVVEELF